MASEKHERQKALEAERDRLMIRLNTEMDSVCESHYRGQIGKMQETLERMMKTVGLLRDAGMNEHKRKDIVSHIEHALQDDGTVSREGHMLYVHGTLDLDKLGDAIAWYMDDDELELEELKQEEKSDGVA